jgi:hypothetical protein
MIALSKRPRSLRLVLTLVLVAGALPGSVRAGRAAPDISGAWTWNELVIVTAPGSVIAGLFGIQIEGPIMHMTCQSGGGLTIQQSGESFTGSADQQWSCISSGGQSAAQGPFPPTFGISGEIAGRSLHFTADVGQGVSCSYRGDVRVSNDTASSFHTTGGCDVPLPFHPNMNKSVYFDATRQ